MQEQTTQVAFPLSRVVIAIAMVVSPVLETLLSSGVLLRATTATPGAAACTPAMALWAGAAATVSRSALLSVASGIDYLSI